MSLKVFKWRLSMPLLSVLSSVVFAAGEEAAQGHASAESEGIFAGDIFSSLFSIVLFIILLAVLKKWAWGPILAGLKKREDHIQESIAIAKKNKEETQQLLEEHQKQLALAKKESESIIAQGREEALKIADQLKQHATEEARMLREQARCDIVHARDRALEQLYNQAVDLSTDLAGRILTRELKPEDHRQLIHEALGDLQKNKM